MMKSVKRRFVICNESRTEFYKRNELSVKSLERAEKFWTRDEAEYWMQHYFIPSQKSLLTQVLPVKITIEVLEKGG